MRAERQAFDGVRRFSWAAKCHVGQAAQTALGSSSRDATTDRARGAAAARGAALQSWDARGRDGDVP